MARPRGIADEQLLAAAQELLYEVGPVAFTLEKAASRAGVSAATLIKRFGSKRQLLLALNRRWVASIGPGVAAATAGQNTALGRLRAAADGASVEWSVAPAGSLMARLEADIDAILASWSVTGRI